MPITQDNILGYCALHGKVLNVADAYEATAWAAISTRLHFDPAWDEQSAWRTQQLLAIPMLIERKYLMGVVLLINKHTSDRFTAVEEDCAQAVAAALGTAPVPPIPDSVAQEWYGHSADTAYPTLTGTPYRLP